MADVSYNVEKHHDQLEFDFSPEKESGGEPCSDRDIIAHDPERPATVVKPKLLLKKLPAMPFEKEARAEENVPAEPAATPAVPRGFWPEKIIGIYDDTYLLAAGIDGLLLIDQHGVHERLLFDRMLKELDTTNCGQELLIPLIVPVTRREQQLLEEHKALLLSLGLAVEPFGETEVSIRSIPMILGQPQAGDLLREVIDQLESERGTVSLEKRRSGILALACKKAVRSGERLREEDLRELVSRMVDEHVTPTSPRGTPLIVALSHADIDRRFRRLQ